MNVTIKLVFEIRECLTAEGTSPFADWLRTLDEPVIARIQTAIVRLELGNLGPVKWIRGIGEYRLHSGPGYRIYLAKDGQRIILLLGGGTKHKQQKDIENALRLWETYKKRQ